MHYGFPLTFSSTESEVFSLDTTVHLGEYENTGRSVVTAKALAYNNIFTSPLTVLYSEFSEVQWRRLNVIIAQK